jgi:hypothetical protein
MKKRTTISSTLFACSCFILFNPVLINQAVADQMNIPNAIQSTSQNFYGKITEVIDAAGYTYAEVDSGDQKVWAAGPVTALKAGDMVSFSAEMPMQNFHSISMDRDFPVIYFIDKFNTSTQHQTGNSENSASPHSPQKSTRLIQPVEGIDKVEGGNSIAEIYTNKQQLNGKMLQVRGKVTKFNPDILGKNWLHIIDSSSVGDLTVTTQGTVEVGDIVIVEGKLGLDRDFYPFILEDAIIIKE